MLRLSMVEIYNEVISDLLDPSRTNLKIREEHAKGIYAEGAVEEVVTSASHALALIEQGDSQRKVGYYSKLHSNRSIYYFVFIYRFCSCSTFYISFGIGCAVP